MSNAFGAIQDYAWGLTGQALYCLPTGLFWLCVKWAGKVLPPFWNGTCTVGALSPEGIAYHSKQQPPHSWDPHFAWYHSRRTYDSSLKYDPANNYLSEGQHLEAILLPTHGVALNVPQLH